MSIELPNVPTAFIGKEPSLDDLITFVEERKEIILEEELATSDTFNVLREYKNASMTKFAVDGQYYLYGQLLILPCDRITNERLQEAISVNTRRFKEYGGPCNSFEAAYIMNHENNFKDVIKIIDLYYNLDEIIHSLYAPGGSGFKRAKEAWAERNGA